MTPTGDPHSWKDYFARPPLLSDDFPDCLPDKPPEDVEPLQETRAEGRPHALSFSDGGSVPLLPVRPAGTGWLRTCMT
jgi:hypothetical protein